MWTLGIGALLFIVPIIVVGPLLVIWALNTLFGLGIAYGLAEWFAVLILTGAVKSHTESKKD